MIRQYQKDWIAKLYEQLSNPEWFVKELGLITNCPLRVSVNFKDDDGKRHTEKKRHTLPSERPLNRLIHAWWRRLKVT